MKTNTIGQLGRIHGQINSPHFVPRKSARNLGLRWREISSKTGKTAKSTTLEMANNNWDALMSNIAARNVGLGWSEISSKTGTNITTMKKSNKGWVALSNNGVHKRIRNSHIMVPSKYGPAITNCATRGGSMTTLDRCFVRGFSTNLHKKTDPESVGTSWEELEEVKLLEGNLGTRCDRVRSTRTKLSSEITPLIGKIAMQRERLKRYEQEVDFFTSTIEKIDYRKMPKDLYVKADTIIAKTKAESDLKRREHENYLKKLEQLQAKFAKVDDIWNSLQDLMGASEWNRLGKRGKPYVPEPYAGYKSPSKLTAELQQTLQSGTDAGFKDDLLDTLLSKFGRDKRTREEVLTSKTVSVNAGNLRELQGFQDGVGHKENWFANGKYQEMMSKYGSHMERVMELEMKERFDAFTTSFAHWFGSHHRPFIWLDSEKRGVGQTRFMEGLVTPPKEMIVTYETDLPKHMLSKKSDQAIRSAAAAAVITRRRGKSAKGMLTEHVNNAVGLTLSFTGKYTDRSVDRAKLPALEDALVMRLLYSYFVSNKKTVSYSMFVDKVDLTTIPPIEDALSLILSDISIKTNSIRTPFLFISIDNVPTTNESGVLRLDEIFQEMLITHKNRFKVIFTLQKPQTDAAHEREHNSDEHSREKMFKRGIASMVNKQSLEYLSHDSVLELVEEYHKKKTFQAAKWNHDPIAMEAVAACHGSPMLLNGVFHLLKPGQPSVSMLIRSILDEHMESEIVQNYLSKNPHGGEWTSEDKFDPFPPPNVPPLVWMAWGANPQVMETIAPLEAHLLSVGKKVVDLKSISLQDRSRHAIWVERVFQILRMRLALGERTMSKQRRQAIQQQSEALIQKKKKRGIIVDPATLEVTPTVDDLLNCTKGPFGGESSSLTPNTYHGHEHHPTDAKSAAAPATHVIQGAFFAKEIGKAKPDYQVAGIKNLEAVTSFLPNTIYRINDTNTNKWFNHVVCLPSGALLATHCISDGFENPRLVAEAMLYAMRLPLLKQYVEKEQFGLAVFATDRAKAMKYGHSVARTIPPEAFESVYCPFWELYDRHTLVDINDLIDRMVSSVVVLDLDRLFPSTIRHPEADFTEETLLPQFTYESRKQISRSEDTTLMGTGKIKGSGSSATKSKRRGRQRRMSPIRAEIDRSIKLAQRKASKQGTKSKQLDVVVDKIIHSKNEEPIPNNEQKKRLGLSTQAIPQDLKKTAEAISVAHHVKSWRLVLDKVKEENDYVNSTSNNNGGTVNITTSPSTSKNSKSNTTTNKTKKDDKKKPPMEKE